jgi:hypothetical protein
MSVLIEHDVRLLDMEVDEERTRIGAGPTAVQMTVRHPGRKRLANVIASLDKASFGCREEPSTELFDEGLDEDEKSH